MPLGRPLIGVAHTKYSRFVKWSAHDLQAHGQLFPGVTTRDREGGQCVALKGCVQRMHAAPTLSSISPQRTDCWPIRGAGMIIVGVISTSTSSRVRRIASVTA